MLGKSEDDFPFARGEVILAKCDKEVYYAKILSLNHVKKTALLLFDDDSKEEVGFNNIYSVNETTADIICVICKEDRTDLDDDIVLCDICSVGYHQRCHRPIIASEVLAPEVPWQCRYCEKGEKNPFVESNPFPEKVKATEMTKLEEQKEILSWYKDQSGGLRKENCPDWKERNKNGNEEYEREDLSDEITPRENIYKTEGDKEEKLTKENTKLNHVEGSAFKLVNKSSDSLKNQDKKIKCTHHDMVNNNNAKLFEEEMQDIDHCSHSDILTKMLSKTIKINRVSPWRKSPTHDLVIDLDGKPGTKETIDELKDGHDSNQETNNALPKFNEKITTTTVTTTATTKSDTQTQQRYAMDLPRHNWLVERLKQEKKIGEKEISQLESRISKEKDEKESHEDISKEEFKNEAEIQIVKVESLSKQTDVDSNVATSSIGLMQNHNLTTSSSSTNDLHYNNDDAKRSRHLSQEYRDTVQSFAAKSNRNEVTNSSSVPDAISIQPRIISSSPSKQYSIPSSEDLALIQYNSLSSFKSRVMSPKSNGYKRDYANTVNGQQRTPTKTGEEATLNQKKYQEEKEQSKLNLPLLKPTVLRVEQTRDPSSGNPQEAFNITNRLSPESVKRRIEIQKQLESQKKWIDEHDTKLQLQSSLERKPNFKSSPEYNTTSNEQLLQLQNQQLLMSPQAIATLQKRNVALNISAAAKQKQDMIEERIKFYTKEINDLKRQKEIITSPQMYNPEEEIYRKRSLEMMNDKLRQLEAYNRKQTAVLLQRNQQQQLYNNQYNGQHLVNSMNQIAVTQISPSQVAINQIPQNQLAFNQIAANQLAATQLAANQIAASQLAANQITANQLVANKIAASQLVANQIAVANQRAYVDNMVNTSKSNLNQRETRVNMHVGRDSRLTDSERNILREAEIQQNLIRQSAALTRKINYYDNPESNDNLLLRQLQNKHDEQTPVDKYPVREELDRPQLLERSRELEEIKQIRQLEALKKAGEVSNMSIKTAGDYLYKRQRSYGPSYQERSFSEREDRLYNYADNDISSKRRSSEPLHPGLSKARRLTPPTLHSRPSPPADSRPRLFSRQSPPKSLDASNHKLSPSYRSRLSPPYLSSNQYKRSPPLSTAMSVVDRSNFISSPRSSDKERYYNGPIRSAFDAQRLAASTEGQFSRQGNFTNTSDPNANKQLIKRYCKLCDKGAQFLCSGCRGIWYCSQECQLSHWRIHSKACKKVE